ncbi:penicillin amidase [Arthrobacter sp. Leaf141]|uniref:penicillin acylase family protein n=1 Tax=Arthrobacter sp. Leaf141 TaxID=1736273 RepID=UPI0006F895B1|nr:penicillin acylase family protein [Arthrobacter sp. Leaf141]KQR01126.1 penicillin amidase [Arthrobacter sp. Leaf141]
MPAETFRDAWGIPHLRADSAVELAYLQGQNAASDRSWQIEMERWRSEGRTAEQLGPEGLLWDRFARQARIEHTARLCFEAMDAKTRAWCAAYVDGVNNALERGRRDAPEFRSSRTAPDRWQPWTPLGVFLVHHILFSTFPNKLWRQHVATALGADAVELFSIEAPVWAGSNSWAVAGGLTATGAPLLAGDPHRLLELPGVYQQVRLACPEFDAVGLAFPGVPGLPHFGHAGKAAWAVTNAMADYQDLFHEQLRPHGSSTQALGPDGWELVVSSHQEIIQVRGGESDSVDVMETLRGPVISGGADGGALSLRMPSRVLRSLGFEALLPLLRSTSAADVEKALEQWVEPVNCVLAADSAGNVRQLVAGRVPVRDARNRSHPVPGWLPEHQWTGKWVKLPRQAVTRLAVHANDRESGGGSLTGLEFAPAHRAHRIRHLLEKAAADQGGGARMGAEHGPGPGTGVVHGPGSGTGPISGPGPHAGLNADHMQRIHLDTRLGSWPALRTVLADLCSADLPLSGPAAALRRQLLGWDGQMDAASSVAGSLAGWRSALVLALARAPQLAPLAEPSGYSALFSPWLSPVARVGFALETVLADGTLFGIDVAAAVRQALEETAAAPAAGPWGANHTVLPLHALADYPASGAVPPGTAPTQLSGDTSCVLSTESLPGLSDGSFRGPVARYVWDLSDRAGSRWIVPFGAAGNPHHPHFQSQLPLWAAGDLIPVVTDWDQLTREDPPAGSES